jgi:hypothetical protein
LDERGLLMLSFDGSRAYELVHSKGMAFCIRGLSGYTIEFAPGGSGKSTELIVHQPSGAAVVKRLPDPDA